MSYTSDMNPVMTTEDGRSWRVRRRNRDGQAEEVPAVTLSELSRRLRRSRRQVYRYLRDGKLVPLGRVMGEWLVQERGAIYATGGAGKPSDPVPVSARIHFPEYHLEDLHPVCDAAVLVPRILDNGDSAAARWLLRQYSRAWLKRWMRNEGWQLSRRSARFWSWWLGVPMPPGRPNAPAPWGR